MDLGSSAASAAYQNSSTSLLSGGFNFDISGILTDALNIVSQSLKIPVIIILLLFAIFAVITLGRLLSQFISRKKVPVKLIKEMIYDISCSESVDNIKNIVNNASIEKSQKIVLCEIADSKSLGKKSREALARKLIEDEEIAERNRAVITGLSDDYGCVVYVDLDSGEEIHYRFDPFFEKHIPGWSKNNIFSKRLKSLSETLIHPDDKSNFDEATKEENVRKEIIQNRVYYVNFRIIIDNQIYYYQVKFVKDDNSDNHVIAGFHSVDDETKRELAALKKAEEASKAKSTFLFNMSHDIPTPMNAIMGFTDLAIKHIDDKEKALENLKKTKSSSEHLLSLINDILDMSRIESGKVELEEKPIDISNIADDILPMLTDLADRKNQKFSFKINKITDRFVYLDYLRMNQILINLVSNSVKYTDEGGKISLSIFQDGRNESGNAIFVFKVQTIS